MAGYQKPRWAATSGRGNLGGREGGGARSLRNRSRPTRAREKRHAPTSGCKQCPQHLHDELNVLPLVHNVGTEHDVKGGGQGLPDATGVSRCSCPVQLHALTGAAVG